MTKRKVCNFLYASDKTPQKTAIWQRGQYFVMDKTGAKDKYRYAVMFIDVNNDQHLLGYQSNIGMAKRFCNYMYINYPFRDKMGSDWDFANLAKKYRIKARPTNTIKQTPPKPSPKPAEKPAEKPKEENPLLDELRKEAIKRSKQTRPMQRKFESKVAQLAKEKLITIKDRLELLDLVVRQ